MEMEHNDFTSQLQGLQASQQGCAATIYVAPDPGLKLEGLLAVGPKTIEDSGNLLVSELCMRSLRQHLSTALSQLTENRTRTVLCLVPVLSSWGWGALAYPCKAPHGPHHHSL